MGAAQAALEQLAPVLVALAAIRAAVVVAVERATASIAARAAMAVTAMCE
jgi:hypothetical protein